MYTNSAETVYKAHLLDHHIEASTATPPRSNSPSSMATSAQSQDACLWLASYSAIVIYLPAASLDNTGKDTGLRWCCVLSLLLELPCWFACNLGAGRAGATRAPDGHFRQYVPRHCQHSAGLPNHRVQSGEEEAANDRASRDPWDHDQEHKD